MGAEKGFQGESIHNTNIIPMLRTSMNDRDMWWGKSQAKEQNLSPMMDLLNNYKQN